MKKTKIVATIGPASDSEDVLRSLIQSGLNVVRLNLSHGDRDSHKVVYDRVRKVANELNQAVAIMADTPGPAIRTQQLKNKTIYLETGNEIIISETQLLGDEKKISIDQEGLLKQLKPGMNVLLANGEIKLEVKESRGNEVLCTILNNAELGERKRVTLPDVEFAIALHTDENIDFAMELEVDYLAASFVKEAADIQKIKEKLSHKKIGVIAKIETKEAADNIDGIIDASDGIMVARGDLGVELPFQDVPILQKSIVEKCNRKGKPVIIATQMLKSMTTSPSPTRAEVTDVANAILDGTDAIMLSEESAIGEYPVETVQVMSQIAERVEREEEVYHRYRGEHHTVTDAIGDSACQVAEMIKAAAIIPSTTSGSTALRVAKFRPNVPIVAVTYSEQARNRLALIWGVTPLCVEFENDTDLMLNRSIQVTSESMDLPKDSAVVITAGVPFGVPGTTNLIKVEYV